MKKFVRDFVLGLLGASQITKVEDHTVMGVMYDIMEFCRRHGVEIRHDKVAEMAMSLREKCYCQSGFSGAFVQIQIRAFWGHKGEAYVSVCKTYDTVPDDALSAELAATAGKRLGMHTRETYWSLKTN